MTTDLMTAIRPSRPLRSARAAKAAAAVALSLAALGGTVAAAAPASAAQTVSFCFGFANPPTFTTYANNPVFLYKYTTQGWIYTGVSGRTNGSGCGTFFNTPTDGSLQVRAYVTSAYQTWDGWSQYYSNPGAGGANLGKGMVYRTR